MSDEPTIHSLDKKIDILLTAVNSDLASRKDFEQRTEKRMDRIESRIDGHSERLARADVIQAESGQLLETFNLIRGQMIRVIINGFLSMFGIITVAGGALVYFLKG